MQDLSEHISDDKEYAIYTYDRYDRHEFGMNKWQKHKSLGSFERALKEAKVLFRSKRYQKIEIKEKYHDKKLKRFVSKTLKSFEHTKTYNHETYIYGLALGLLLLSLYALMKF